jgi:hypothetical protein
LFFCVFRPHSSAENQQGKAGERKGRKNGGKRSGASDTDENSAMWKTFSCITHHIFAYVYIAGYKCMSIPVFTKSGASGVF